MEWDTVGRVGLNLANKRKIVCLLLKLHTLRTSCLIDSRPTVGFQVFQFKVILLNLVTVVDLSADTMARLNSNIIILLLPSGLSKFLFGTERGSMLILL